MLSHAIFGGCTLATDVGAGPGLSALAAVNQTLGPLACQNQEDPRSPVCVANVMLDERLFPNKLGATYYYGSWGFVFRVWPLVH